MFARKLYEVNSVAAHANGELRILLGVFHRVLKHFAVEYVHIEVVCTLGKVAVHHCNEVLNTVFSSSAQTLGYDAKRVRNTVL